MIDFTNVPNIHYWTQRVLPCVFDESLSYVEKINKLEEEFNNLINDYNKFGQNVVTEINTFEEETTNQINSFIQQVTDEINTFKSDITNQLNTFETTITNKQNAFETRILELTEEFETTINNDIATFKQTITAQQEEFENRVNSNIDTMQEVVNEIPNTVTTQVNAITQPWLVSNVPAMVESSVANNVNKVFDVDQLYNSGTSSTIGDINNWTDTGIYFGTTNREFHNFPNSVSPGYNFWCIVCHSTDTTVNNPLQQNLYISNGNVYYRQQSDNQQWDNWYKSNISLTNIPKGSIIDFDSYFYSYIESANGDMWITIFHNYRNWINAPSGFNSGDIALITSNISYDGSSVIYVENVTKIGSTASNPQYIGKTWSRCKVGSTWSPWNPTTLDYQYKEILTDTQLNDLTETGIYTISSESGVTIGGLPSTALQYGSFYIRVTANNIGTNSDEIIQEIINAGTGASSYTREKQGAQWSNWSKTRRLVYTTNTLASITQGSWGHDFNTQIPITGVEGLAGGYEAELTVSASSASTQMPSLVTGVVLNSVDSKIHANVLLYSPNTSLISGSYNVTLTVYDKR